LTASQSDGSPTISETQTPQKHERELVTLEYLSIRKGSTTQDQWRAGAPHRILSGRCCRC
jgi:hypothetical protein